MVQKFNAMIAESMVILPRLQWHKKETVNKKLGPENLWGKFQQRSSQSNYAKRHCKDLHIPRLNTEHAKKGYQYSTVKIWNTIPTDIRELPTISHFKKELKDFLKS